MTTFEVIVAVGVAAICLWIGDKVGEHYGRIDEAKLILDRINQYIKPGELSGNGCDETAQRNGMVLASNIVCERTKELKDR